MGGKTGSRHRRHSSSRPHSGHSGHRSYKYDRSFSRSSDSSAGHSNQTQYYTVEFKVSQNLLGFVIGSGGHNIKAAKNLDDIASIVVNDDGVVRIKAYSKDACDKARDMLEYVEDELDVNRNYVGRCIGKQGSNLGDIMEKSGVIKIKVVGDKEKDSDLDATPFVFIGTKKAVEYGMWLLDEHILDCQERDRSRMYSNDFDYY